MTVNRYYVFQKDDPTEVVGDILTRYRKIATFIINRGIMARWVKSFNSYYGYYYQDPKAAYGIGTGGTQGELTLFSVNHYRNLILHVLSMLTQNKIAFDSVPINSDVEGRNAAIVSNELLEYYFSQNMFSQEIYKLIEIGMIFGTSFMKVDWLTDKKFEGIDADENAVYSGDARFQSFTPLDVVLEPFKSNEYDHDWITTREIYNRYELVEQYPELEEKILALPRVQDVQLADPYFITDDNHVWLYKLYHRATRALPFGRMIEFGAEDCIFKDYQKDGHKYNPYCEIDIETKVPIVHSGLPIKFFRPAEVYGSAWGHTVGFDLLPIQDIKNMLSSTIASNQAAFGVQNLIVARGTNIDFADLPGGLRVQEFDAQPDLPGGGAPTVLELLKTPQEIFNYNNKIDEEFEKISGINGALRGTPPPQVGSGTAMALLTTQAQTFNNQLENTYIACVEDLAMKLIKLIAKFMPDRDMISIIGMKEKYAITNFRGAELTKISRIKIITGNALSKSPAGRLAMAQDMLNTGQITPVEYQEVVRTGTIQNKQEDITSAEAYIHYENQQLLQGIPVVSNNEQLPQDGSKFVQALISDNPLTHIKSHITLLTNPDVRMDPQKVQNIMKHLADHQQYWVQLGVENPQLLALITGSPIPPDVPNPGVVPGQGPQGAPPQGPPGGNQPPGPPVGPQGVVAPPGSAQSPGGVGVNNVANASSPGGQNDLALSALRSAEKVITSGRR